MKKILLIFIFLVSFKVKAQFCLYDSTLNNFISEWIGKPYKFGGKTKNGIDCSNFVRTCYKEVYDRVLVGTTKYIFRQTNRVTKEMLSVGDILFFKSRQSPSGWHCGVYIGDNKFVHAANRKEGVKISALNEKIYEINFLGGGRL